MLTDFVNGNQTTFTKNPGYWGKDIALNKGLWNFDTVRFDYEDFGHVWRVADPVSPPSKRRNCGQNRLLFDRVHQHGA